ncbi:hypothetical protein DID88_010508 [Monilinia fructigena]|uniref:Uncharacterized protein n=1 Tax=Monilinia fructigena TaxID=38457 RepID=A0A395IS47_9HELO|nr:hypothetical protein DID88_010508 [Monilinia fructigena]
MVVKLLEERKRVEYLGSWAVGGGNVVVDVEVEVEDMDVGEVRDIREAGNIAAENMDVGEAGNVEDVDAEKRDVGDGGMELEALDTENIRI